MSFEAIGKLIKNHVQAKPGIAGQVQAARVVAAATAVFAERFPALSARLTVQSVRDGVLTVRAQSGAAAAECRLREPQILALLREKLGAGVVRALRYRL